MEIEVGMKFSRLTVVSQVGNLKRWNCVCECGNTKWFPASDLISGHDKSCGCIQEAHGMRYHRAYKSWLHMKQRCTNPKNQDYANYGGRGVTVHEDFSKSFTKWLAEIGEKPDDGQRWSIGRLDNNVGYTYGNMRWETDEQQARNHTLLANNKSGIVGVTRRERDKDGNIYTTWIAQWANETNKKKSKEFSCNKYGEDAAKALAIAYRDKMIAELNNRGFDYADTHGQEKLVLNG